MAMRTGRDRRKTRYKWQKKPVERGKIPIRKFLQDFKDGQQVVLVADPIYQKGMYFRRFHGKVGVVAGKSGRCYQIKIHDAGKPKMLIVNAVHLKRV